jgi:catechol-2,3-dioxygenase
MIRVKRVRHTALATQDLEHLLEYYQSVVGLGVITRDGKRVYLGSDSDQLTTVIEQDTSDHLGAIAFEVAPDSDLGELQRTLTRLGVRSEIRSDSLPGIPKTLTFSDPDGHRIDLFSEWQFCKSSEPIRGLAVNKLGHVALRAPDPQATAQFYQDTLGFRVSDRIEENFVFMRCGFEHHSMNFARGVDGRLHHLAFELRDASHMHQACDLLGRRKIPILWGPVRHGPGHNVAVYHRSPDGCLIELFYDMDLMVDEELGYFEPRPWHRDRPQRPKTWVGLPRDVWGVGPDKAALEFSPEMRGAVKSP